MNQRDFDKGEDIMRALESALHWLAGAYENLKKHPERLRGIAQVETPPVDNEHVAAGCEQFAETTPDQKELGYLWRRLFAIYKVNGGILDFNEWQERERELARET